MKSPEMGMGAPNSPEEKVSKFLKRAIEIKENVPKNQLEQVISELEKYLKLRRLNETQYQDLPDSLREEIGTRDPMDEFLDEVVDFDSWDTLSDEYGIPPDNTEPKWTIDELEQLINELKKSG